MFLGYLTDSSLCKEIVYILIYVRCITLIIITSYVIMLHVGVFFIDVQVCVGLSVCMYAFAVNQEMSSYICLCSGNVWLGP